MKAKQSVTAPHWKEPQVFYRNGRPVSVLMDFKDYRKLLERLEDEHDLRRLAQLDKRPLHYRPIEEFMDDLARR